MVITRNLQELVQLAQQIVAVVGEVVLTEVQHQAALGVQVLLLCDMQKIE